MTAQLNAARTFATRGLAAALVLTGCSSVGVDGIDGSVVVVVADTGDPIPQVSGEPETLGTEGGTVDRGVVRVSAEDGDVPAGHEFTVDVGPALGDVSLPFGDEYFGEPVLVEHGVELAGPLTVSWDVSGLTDMQRSAMVIVGWDEAEQVWVPTGEQVVIDGDWATAEVTQFSFKTFATFSEWVAETLNQNVGKLTGSRTDAPDCASDPLPSWVTNTVRPDEDLGGVSLLTCFETDTDDQLTLRAANNRPFAQFLRHTDGDQSWAWTWPGVPEISGEGAVYAIAADVLKSDTGVMLPPIQEIAVGFARPGEPGAYHVAMEASAGAVTIAVDVVANVVGAQPVGGFDNPVQNAFFQVLFECAAPWIDSRLNGADEAVEWSRVALSSVQSCSEEILRPASDFGARFEDLSRSMLASGGWQSVTALQANRWVHKIAGALTALKVAEAASYIADQVAESLVGPSLVSFNATGLPQPIGQWAPTCRDTSADSDLLYRNLALQDQFAGSSGNSPGWAEAATQAVAPLAGCDGAYRTALADMLPGDWGDREAAEVVAEAIRLLGGTDRVTIQHPTWGQVTVRVTGEPDPTAVTSYGVQVVDLSGQVLWERSEHDIGDYGWALNAPATDDTGNVFIKYNPGRLDGIIVLRPIPAGMDDLGTAEPQDAYRKRFYGADAVDLDGDGKLEVRHFVNDCDPSCAGGTVTETVYRWDGTGYSAR